MQLDFPGCPVVKRLPCNMFKQFYIFLISIPQTAVISLIINWNWISLVRQWLSICLLMQGTRVQSLLQEDPMCCQTTEPVRRSGWVCVLEPRRHYCWSPPALEPVLCGKRGLFTAPRGWPLLTAAGESPLAARNAQHGQKKKRWQNWGLKVLTTHLKLQKCCTRSPWLQSLCFSHHVILFFTPIGY